MKSYFYDYNVVLNDIEAMQYELINLKESFYRITGMKYGDAVNSTVKVTMEDLLNEIEEVNQMIKAKQKVKKEMREKHMNDIRKLEDDRYRTIIKLYYLDRCPLKQISYCLGLSDSHTKKLKSHAMKEFLKLIEK